jgi:hypothetical protein
MGFGPVLLMEEASKRPAPPPTSDWPFAPELAVTHFDAMLAEYPGLDDHGRTAVDSRDARRLFPRLATV